MQDRVALASLTRTDGVDAALFSRLMDKGLVFRFKQILGWPGQGEQADIGLSAVRSGVAGCQGSADGIVLLEGVTGAGKTEVYTHLIDQVLEQGRDALFLVPEIALTTQLIVRLRKFFGERLEVYHSRFTPRERTTTFRRVAEERGKGRRWSAREVLCFSHSATSDSLSWTRSTTPATSKRTSAALSGEGAGPCWGGCTGQGCFSGRPHRRWRPDGRSQGQSMCP